MSLSKSITSYEDLIPVLEHALSAERGIRIDASTYGRAVHMRQRIYALRSIKREQSLEIYPVGHPARGTCEWDCLTAKIEPGDTFLYLTRLASPVIEEL